jgi:transcriptional regulator with XRE-family HTH domain
MNQPNLGKKIAELRQAKGYTQEELAKKCNLSVRTIQRIELAEVTPRSFTIKAIFSSLDYDIYNSFGNISYKLDRTVYMAKKWPGQFYKYVLDLFNLKTNPMRKIVILSIPIMTIVIVLFLSGANSIAQNAENIKKQLIRKTSNSNFGRLFNQGKIDSICLDYAPNACMMPDQYPTIFSREKIAEYFLQLYVRGIRFADNNLHQKDRVDTLIVNNNIAIERGSWKVIIGPDIEISGTYLIHWQYVNGNWQIENEMSKSDFMPLPNRN